MFRHVQQGSNKSSSDARWRQLVQMFELFLNVSLITVIYSMLWLLLIIAVILWPTHLSTQHTALYVPRSRLRETRVPRRRAQLNTLSYSIKQSHRDGLSLPFCFSFKSCGTGPSGKRDLPSAMVPSATVISLSPSEIKLAFFCLLQHAYLSSL